MKDTDSSPELIITSPLVPASSRAIAIAPQIILGTQHGEKPPESTGVKLFWLEIEEEPEFYLYAIGKVIGSASGESLDIGETERVKKSLDWFIHSSLFEQIVDVDSGTRTALESDGDYQLLAQRYRNYQQEHGAISREFARQIRLRMLRTYIIRSVLYKYNALDGEAA